MPTRSSEAERQARREADRARAAAAVQALTRASGAGEADRLAGPLHRHVFRYEASEIPMVSRWCVGGLRGQRAALPDGH